MYDNGGETDCTIRLQSALLLGFYHSDDDAHAEPWYWTGIAISLCQIMGLHRPPHSAPRSPRDERQQRLWRRLWWCCLFRDRWLSLTLGRPLRINLDDCDVPEPVAADLLCDTTDLPQQVPAIYTPSDLPQLAEDWVKLIRLSKMLGDVLALWYRPVAPAPKLQQFEALEAEALLFRTWNKEEPRSSQLATFSLCHLKLHYQ